MSTKSVADKLQIKPGARVWVLPAAHAELLDPLPPDVDLVADLSEATAAVAFVNDATALEALLTEHGGRLGAQSLVWIAYPKANRSDLNRDRIPPFLLAYSMRPIGQVAVDEMWSALRFRLLREGETFQGGGR